MTGEEHDLSDLDDALFGPEVTNPGWPRARELPPLSDPDLDLALFGEHREPVARVDADDLERAWFGTEEPAPVAFVPDADPVGASQVAASTRPDSSRRVERRTRRRMGLLALGGVLAIVLAVSATVMFSRGATDVSTPRATVVTRPARTVPTSLPASSAASTTASTEPPTEPPTTLPVSTTRAVARVATTGAPVAEPEPEPEPPPTEPPPTEPPTTPTTSSTTTTTTTSGTLPTTT